MKATRGFTLLEIMIAIGLIAILGTVLITNIGRRSDKYEREHFVEQLNSLVQAARHHAMGTLVPHRAVFKLESSRGRQGSWIEQAWIEQDTQEKDRDGLPIFKPVRGWRNAARMEGNRRFRITQFVIDGYDEMQRYVGRGVEEVWFHVVPDGVTQEVTIGVVDSAKGVPRAQQKMRLELNPFTGQFQNKGRQIQ